MIRSRMENVRLLYFGARINSEPNGLDLTYQGRGDQTKSLLGRAAIGAMEEGCCRKTRGSVRIQPSNQTVKESRRGRAEYLLTLSFLPRGKTTFVGNCHRLSNDRPCLGDENAAASIVDEAAAGRSPCRQISVQMQLQGELNMCWVSEIAMWHRRISDGVCVSRIQALMMSAHRLSLSPADNGSLDQVELYAKSQPARDGEES
nr:hypothetical protein Iba_chr07aCG12010 [Ipomoea batatas]